VSRKRALAGIMLGAAALGAAPAAASEAGGRLHPSTWLDFLARAAAEHHLLTSKGAQAFAWSLLACLIVGVVCALGTRKASVKPGRFQLLLEMLVSSVRGLVVSVMGPEGEAFVPFVGTLLIYIAVMNLLGLMPGAMAGTANLTITAALALVVFVVVQYVGFRRHGLRYMYHFVEGVPRRLVYLPLLVLIFFIHVVSEIVRPVTLALRLFGNMFAGETLILMMIGLVAPLYLKRHIPIPVQLPNMMLEVLIAVAQALVFAMLAVVYLAGVMESPDEEEH